MPPPGANNRINNAMSFDESPPVTKKAQDAKLTVNTLGADPSPDNFKVPGEYLISLSSTAYTPDGTAVTVVTAKMQEALSMRVGSEWKPFLPTGKLTDAVNSIMQVATGKAAVASVTSRRLWSGSQPLTMTCNFQFEAITDAKKDVILPCIYLMQLASPSNTGGKIPGLSSVPLLSPPGPSPFIVDEATVRSAVGLVNKALPKKFELDADDVAGKITKFVSKGDNITIKYGKFATFKQVILSAVDITFANKLTKEGLPVSGKASVTFETYEIVTKEGFDDIFRQVEAPKAYPKKPDPPQPKNTLLEQSGTARI